MSASAWMRRQRGRPIAEHERRTAMVAIIVLLATVAVLFTLTQPASQASRPASRDRKARTSRAGAVLERDNRDVGRVAKRFLAGYLSYTYGRSPADRIADASRSLTASLQAHPPTVSPAVRARHPRIVSLQPSVAGGGLVVTATVNDGGIVDYRVGVLLAREHGRLLVIGLEGA